MTITVPFSSSTLLPASQTAIFTSSGNNAVVAISFCNTSASATNVTMWILPSGGSIGAWNMIVNQAVIAGNDTFIFNAEKFLLSNGDIIYAQAGVASQIAVTISSLSI